LIFSFAIFFTISKSGVIPMPKMAVLVLAGKDGQYFAPPVLTD
jgi:hypothetical protein